MHFNRALHQDGALAIYAYITKSLNSEKYPPSDDQLLQDFYQTVKPHFEFDRDDLHTHYSDKQKYPFE